MIWPDFTTEPRSTLIDSTNAGTFGNTATDWYACSSPGSRTMISSLRETTLVTSTVGVGAGWALALGVGEPEFASHPMHNEATAVPTINVRSGRALIVHPLMVGQMRSQPAKKRFADHLDRAKEMSYRPSPE